MDIVRRNKSQFDVNKTIMLIRVQNSPNTTVSAQTKAPTMLNKGVNPYGFFFFTHCLSPSKNPEKENKPNNETTSVC